MRIAHRFKNVLWPQGDDLVNNIDAVKEIREKLNVSLDDFYIQIKEFRKYASKSNNRLLGGLISTQLNRENREAYGKMSSWMHRSDYLRSLKNIKHNATKREAGGFSSTKSVASKKTKIVQQPVEQNVQQTEPVFEEDPTDFEEDNVSGNPATGGELELLEEPEDGNPLIDITNDVITGIDMETNATRYYMRLDALKTFVA